jgi:hypothetical protein
MTRNFDSGFWFGHSVPPSTPKISKEERKQQQRQLQKELEAELKRLKKEEQLKEATAQQAALSGEIPLQDVSQKKINFKLLRRPEEPFCFSTFDNQQQNEIRDIVASNFPYSLRDPFLRYLTYHQDSHRKNNQKQPNVNFLRRIKELTNIINDKENNVNKLYEEIAFQLSDQTQRRSLEFARSQINPKGNHAAIEEYFNKCKLIVNSKRLNEVFRQRLSNLQDEVSLAHRSRLNYVHDYLISNTRLHVNNFPHDSNMKERVKLACLASEKLFDYRTMLFNDSLKCSSIGPLEQYKLVKQHCETNVSSLADILRTTLKISSSELESLLAETRKDQEVYSQKLDDFRKL